MRTRCPTCSCGFDKNPDLFPDLTSTKVHQALRKIRNQSGMVNFLEENKLQLSQGKDGEIIFPHGLCQSVQNKIRIKITELKISIGSSKQKEFDLLPATGPDDLLFPIATGNKGILSWNEPGAYGGDALSGISAGKIESEGQDWLESENAWEGSPEEATLDE